MKKFIVIIGLSLTCLSFVGCSDTPMYNSKEDKAIIQQVEESYRCEVYMDSENGVMYFVRYDGGITVMYEPDGSVKIHPDYKNKTNSNTQKDSNGNIIINNNNNNNN